MFFEFLGGSWHGFVLVSSTKVSIYPKNIMKIVPDFETDQKTQLLCLEMLLKV